ncbi:S1 family peptidase [Demequina activiva]|uniref:Serine protease n=1 Tax=Demequina activiva TaxID=1582364 RepID=A0A919Q308_9MICO|nr:serine protease [Demequina activiva]GIG54317.1 hypothetical protein Dac01nite_10690 [Demequina activiva]
MRRTPLAVALATGTLAIAGCAPLPTAPQELPATFIPEVEAPSPWPEMPVGEDGFTVVERVAVRVSAVTCDSYQTGSAWVLDENTVVTNRHVVEDAVEIELTSYDGRHYTGTSSVLDATADLALVTIDGTFPEAATIAQDPAEQGEQLYVVGYPEGDILTTTPATFQGQAPETLGEGQDDIDVLWAEIKQGNSGSPLADVNGEVVGVIYAGNDGGGASSVTHESLMDFLTDESTHEPNEAACSW